MIQNEIETYKSNCDVSFDKYGTELQPSPNINYRQERFFFWNDSRGFSYHYDFTSDGQPNDLTLILEFIYNDNNIEILFHDLHVL